MDLVAEIVGGITHFSVAILIGFIIVIGILWVLGKKAYA